jgi:hypothetical protein
VNFVQSSRPFNGHVCYLSQFAPFTTVNYNQAIAGLHFIEKQYEGSKPIKFNFFLSSSQFTNFSTCDCKFDIPFDARYEMMVANVVSMAKQFNFVPSGLYHVADFETHNEWLEVVLPKIRLGSIIISNDCSNIFDSINKIAPGNYGHLIFAREDIYNFIHTDEIKKLITHGHIEEAKKYLPAISIEIMSKHGLLG